MAWYCGIVFEAQFYEALGTCCLLCSGLAKRVAEKVGSEYFTRVWHSAYYGLRLIPFAMDSMPPRPITTLPRGTAHHLGLGSLLKRTSNIKTAVCEVVNVETAVSGLNLD